MLYFHTVPRTGTGTTAGARGRWSRPAVLALLLPLFSALLPSAAACAEAALSLADALERALRQNPSLQVYAFRQEALAGAAYTANLGSGFELGLEAENFAGSGELEGFDNAELTVSLSSVLELGGKRSARQAVVSGSRSLLETQRQLESLDLLGEVTRRYIDALAAQHRVELAREASELARQTLTVVSARAAAGAVPDAEVRRAQAAVARAGLAEAAQQRELEYLRVALGSLWGATSPGFSRVEGDLYALGDDLDFDTLYAGLADNPALQLYAARERVAAAELRLAKARSSGDINWSLGLRQLREVDDTALVAGVSMPLFAGRRVSGEVSRLAAERSLIAVDRQARVLDLHTQLFGAYHNRQQARLAVTRLRDDIIPALEQALEQTRQGYQRGHYGYPEYISASQELLDSRRMLIDSAASALRYGAEIEQLTAAPLQSTRTGSTYSGVSP